MLPAELGLAEEVVLVELDRPVKTRAEAAGQAVGVLSHDEVALLQPQDALGLHPERLDPEVGAAVHQRLPDVQPVARRDVQFVRQLAGEADPPQHAPVHPGDPARPHLHVAERLVCQVDILGDPRQQVPGRRAGHVHAGVGGRHRGDVHRPVRVHGLQHVLQPLPHRRGPRGRGAHQVVVRAQVAGDAVVEDHAVLGAHHAVPDPAEAELGPLVHVHQVEQPRHVGTAQVELADRGDVDDADLAPHVADLGGRVTVVIGPDPGPGDQRAGAVRLVPRLHR